MTKTRDEIVDVIRSVTRNGIQLSKARAGLIADALIAAGVIASERCAENDSGAQPSPPNRKT